MDEAAKLAGFPPELFRERRERALEELGDGAMVLPAAPPLLRTGDSEIPYRPDSELFYLTGFTEPEALLVLRGFAEEDREVLFVRPRDPKGERWTGARLGPDDAPSRLGIEAARSTRDLPAELPGLLDGADAVHFRMGVHADVERLVVQALRRARARGARRGTGPRAVVDPGGILDELRLRKSSEELAALREAARITALGVRRAIEAARPGAGEWELEALVESTFRLEGARAPAFATIVGSGPNACVLHYTDNARRAVEGELVLIDAGAEVRLYAGDLTRTFPVGGRFTPEQRALYEVVEEARRQGVAAIRPGATVAGVHEAAVEVLLGGLRGLGILAGDPDELREAEAWKAFFPHQTSHWLGLNAHDPGDYARAGTATVLEEGMVLTVEPGLYLDPDPPADLGAPGFDREGAAPWLGLGIRIEDAVVVTGDGPEVVTAGVPTDPDDLEEIVGVRG